MKFNDNDSLFSALLPQLPFLMGIWNPDSGKLHPNRQMCELLGWSEQDFASSCPLALLFPEPRLRQQVEQFLDTNDRQWRDFPCRTSSGGRIDIAWLRVVLKDGSCVLVGLENGERKRREERLKRAADLAVAANEAKIELFASVGHEVRNPLNSIMGFAQILESELADSFHRGCASTIHENGRFLLEIINDLIDITRIENNKLSMRFSAVNPWETIVAVRDLMNIVARDKNLPLEIERGGNVPDEFVSDPKRLRQILINLVGNSIKFTDAGAIRIVLSHDPGAALPLRIEVVDTGVGIEAGEMDRLFEPFFQGSNHSAGGAGLGLSICRKLAAMMGGELSLQSELDKGSTFTLALPLQPELPEVQR